MPKMPCLQKRLSSLAVAAAVVAPSVLAVPSVNIDMTAAFSPGPYLVELLETAAAENDSCYFPILDRIAYGTFISASTEKELYEQFLDVLRDDGHITGSGDLATFNLALSLRSSAPRVEAHYQYYATAVESSADLPPGGCETWITLEGRPHCTSQLDGTMGKTTLILEQLPFDRVVGTGPDAILYTDITSESFPEFHNMLIKRARNSELSYRVRYKRSASVVQTIDSQAGPLPVSGYGVALALKRTDYIVIDDREPHAEAQEAIITQDEHHNIKPLSTSELKFLGLKAASFITQSDSPFDTLLELIQDFPKFSAAVAANKIYEPFVAEHTGNRKLLAPSGFNVLWMNGVQLIERQIEPFSLLNMMRRERRLISGMKDLGLSGSEAVNLLSHEKMTAPYFDEEPARFEWRDGAEEGKVIIWLNDLENDLDYDDYPTSLTALLQQTFPGQLPPIRRNIFNVVVPLDLSDSADIAVALQFQAFVTKGIPIRFGITPLVPSPTATNHATVAYHLVSNYGKRSVYDFLAALRTEKDGVLNEALFKQIIKNREPNTDSRHMSLEEILSSPDPEVRIQLASRWARRLNANKPSPFLLVNGVVVPRTEGWLQAMSTRLSTDLKIIQEHVFVGELTDKSSVADFFMKSAAPARNLYVFPQDPKSLRILDVSKLHAEHKGLFSKLPVIEATLGTTQKYWASFTAVLNTNTASGLEMLLSAIQFRRENPGVRLEIIDNQSASGPVHRNFLKIPVDQLNEAESVDDLEDLIAALPAGEDEGYRVSLAGFLTKSGLEFGDNAFILNGRLLGPVLSNDVFSKDDYQLLLGFEQKRRILPVLAAVDDLGLGSKLDGPLAVAKLTSITALSMISELPEGISETASGSRTRAFSAFNSSHSAIEVGDMTTAAIHLTCLLDPVSEQGQRWVPILKTLSELDGVYLRVYLNPRDNIDELPVKRFFRYVLSSVPLFDQAGRVATIGASFKGLPSEVLMTAAMDVPPAWLVAPLHSAQDLDNVRLASAKNDIKATYELKHILIEGHSREAKGVPRGAQLVLGTGKDNHLTDTIVMSNLGFFQFKANPGFYSIRLKEGRSSEVYTIDNIGSGGWDAGNTRDLDTGVMLMTFQGLTLFPRMRRNSGMEKVDVLADSETENGSSNIVSRGLKLAEGLLSTIKNKKYNETANAAEHADINIFSVASGRLYERMLHIMMVSVMRHTKHSVKFWFIEQFLSPSFKDSIADLAEAYGFRYEMVMYKWPHWLRQQKEKQREIWGYKILFLDVLFPLSLDKVIFVDADQIVRADMFDLVSHDLQGAPYGFTPMCDSRTEMEGFRFWKQGYWANYLRGLPYHISALYVVDLRKFRQIAAGDRLRQQYHTLSADPNSLSNLDQDLPNHMQFMIPIHSLPQEWLWCETWCSDESFSAAKTIDLCNNPLTKEPKLDRARRQVPEWIIYDEEIAALNSNKKTARQAENELSPGVDARQKNTKSRRLDAERTDQAHVKDEL